MTRTGLVCRGDDGFALAEVMVAAALLVAVAAGLSHVVGTSIRANLTSRSRTVATSAAAQKMEQLQSLSWSESADVESGAVRPMSDTTTDLSTEPATASGPGLMASPAGTLQDNTPPYVDYLDAAGTWVGRGSVPPPSAVYIRRWSITPLDADPDNTLVFQVFVTTSRERPSTSRVGLWRSESDVRLVSARTRRAR